MLIKHVALVRQMWFSKDGCEQACSINSTFYMCAYSSLKSINEQIRNAHTHMRNLRTPKIHNPCMYQHTHTSIYVHVNKYTSSTCADELRNNAVLVRHPSKRLRVTAGGATQSLLGATHTDTHVQGLQESLKTGPMYST